jgi:hypothetical protein
MGGVLHHAEALTAITAPGCPQLEALGRAQHARLGPHRSGRQ